MKVSVRQPKSITIETDGTPLGTTIKDAAGLPINGLITAVDIAIRPEKPVTATVTFDFVEVKAVASMKTNDRQSAGA